MFTLPIPFDAIINAHSFLSQNVLSLILLVLVIDGVTTAVSVRFGFENASPSVTRLTHRTNALTAFCATNGLVAALMYLTSHQLGLWFSYFILTVFSMVMVLNLYQVFKTNLEPPLTTYS